MDSGRSELRKSSNIQLDLFKEGAAFVHTLEKGLFPKLLFFRTYLMYTPEFHATGYEIPSIFRMRVQMVPGGNIPFTSTPRLRVRQRLVALYGGVVRNLSLSYTK